MSDLQGGCGHVPERFAGGFLDSFDATVGKAAAVALRAIEQVVAGELRMVLLSGPVGCGKSHLAAIACNELAARLARPAIEAEAAYQRASTESTGLVDPAIVRTRQVSQHRLSRECPRWISVPALLARLRREIRSDERYATADVADAARAVGLVVVDDLGSEKTSEWTAQVLFEIVGPRYDARLPLLITSNQTTQQLADAGYERIVSRLADGGALIEMASASDYRQRLRRSVR